MSVNPLRVGYQLVRRVDEAADRVCAVDGAHQLGRRILFTASLRYGLLFTGLRVGNDVGQCLELADVRRDALGRLYGLDADEAVFLLRGVLAGLRVHALTLVHASWLAALDEAAALQ